MIKLGFYKHFKGNLYKVLHVAKHSETDEYYVVYQPQYGQQDIWVRPLAMFDETIERNGQQLKRFSYIEQSS